MVHRVPYRIRKSKPSTCIMDCTHRKPTAFIAHDLLQSQIENAFLFCHGSPYLQSLSALDIERYTYWQERYHGDSRTHRDVCWMVTLGRPVFSIEPTFYRYFTRQVFNARDDWYEQTFSVNPIYVS